MMLVRLRFKCVVILMLKIKLWMKILVIKKELQIIC